MTEERKAASRLDALLTGLEEDIFSLDDHAIVTEGEESFSNVGRVRTLIESAINSHPQAYESKGSAGTHTVGDKTTWLIARSKAHPAGKGHATSDPKERAVPNRIRMAFSSGTDAIEQKSARKIGTHKRRGKASTTKNRT